MVTLSALTTTTPPLSFPTLLSIKRPLPSFKSSLVHYKTLLNTRKVIKRGICRAELSDDAPFAAAIGVCMLASLLLPDSVANEGDGADSGTGDSGLDATDTRLAAMGVISFIPYFNWLSWVFAWLDTGKRRYAVYALVYLIPYVRSNMSLSPEESWLPIASIVLGIIHVQLEASIRNGDLELFRLFSKSKEYQGLSEQDGTQEQGDLPSAGEKKSRNEVRNWGIPREQKRHHEHSNGDWDDGESSRRRN